MGNLRFRFPRDGVVGGTFWALRLDPSVADAVARGLNRRFWTADPAIVTSRSQLQTLPAGGDCVMIKVIRSGRRRRRDPGIAPRRAGRDEYESLVTLQEAGIGVVEPLGWGRNLIPWGPFRSLLVTGYEEHRMTLHRLLAEGIEPSERVYRLEAVGTDIGRILAAEWALAEPDLTNVLVDPTNPGSGLRWCDAAIVPLDRSDVEGFERVRKTALGRIRRKTPGIGDDDIAVIRTAMERGMEGDPRPGVTSG